MKNRRDNKFGTTEAIKRIGVSAERLRYWESAGVVKPEYVRCGTREFRRYAYQDIQRALLVKNLVDEEKYTLEGAIRKMKTAYT